MEPSFLKCPNCGHEQFFIKKEGVGLVFIKVNADGKILVDETQDVELEQADTTSVCCTGCGWYGEVSELKR